MLAYLAAMGVVIVCLLGPDEASSTTWLQRWWNGFEGFAEGGRRCAGVPGPNRVRSDACAKPPDPSPPSTSDEPCVVYSKLASTAGDAAFDDARLLTPTESSCSSGPVDPPPIDTASLAHRRDRFRLFLQCRVAADLDRRTSCYTKDKLQTYSV